MRRTAGWLLLGAGIAGLSYWGHENQADTIQTMIATDAAALGDTARHEVSAQVSGRDVTLEGTAHDEAERDRLLAAAAELPGHRVVRDNLRLLPVAETYEFTAQKTAQGLDGLTGVVPDNAAFDAVRAAAGTASTQSLTIAAGAPNDGWSKALSAGLSGLGALDTGSLAVTGATAKIAGTADTDADLAALQDAISAAPEGYAWDLAVTVRRPDVDAYAFSAGKTEEGLTLNGFMPTQAKVDGLFAANPGATGEVALAANAPEGWDSRVGGAVAALDYLESGEAEVTPDGVTITGVAADAEAKAAFDAALATLAGSGTVNAIIEVPEPPEPAVAAPVVDESETDPAQGITEPEFEVAMDPITGLTVSGFVPAGLDADKIAQIVGVAKVSGSETALEDADGAVAEGKLAAISDIVGDFESLRISFRGDAMSVVGETLFDADPLRLERFLNDVAQSGDSISVARSETIYADGFERPNALTGNVERFTGGFWIPVFDAAELTRAECAQRTAAAVEQTKIRFEPGSAEIDSLSRQILNDLTGIIGACMRREPQTRIQIGGHTDDVGTDEYNLGLSNDRAGNVLAALVERGLPEDQLTAVGYGESSPVADNTTEEGRAANRRTTFEWLE